MKCARLVALAALLAFPISAQLPATLTGKVEKAPAGACDAAATHQVTCTNVLLKSSTVDLTALVGKTVELKGTALFQGSCVTIDVQSAPTATEQTTALALFGYRLGRPIVFTTSAPLGALVFYLFGTGPGFLPLGASGSYLMQLAGSVYWTFDISIGVAIRPVTVPSDPALVGINFLMQTAYVTISPLSLGILNPLCWTVTQ
jgi:hypothetical protein